jgi:rhodanese-related sulfurtransferase
MPFCLKRRSFIATNLRQRQRVAIISDEQLSDFQRQETAMDHSPGFLKAVNEAKSRVRENTPEDVKRKQDAGESFYFVDVREDNEWQKGHAAGAIHLGKGIIERDIEKAIPDHDAEVILYCGGGFRSALAADALQNMGYKNVISMDGGWTRWRALGYTIED